jgi:hypothetical protein
MKINRLGTFTLGVIITAVSVGAVSFVNASGDANIRACANKKTGAMRYIAKGKCKKTEKALTWSQMGPQGIAGAAGVKGDSGPNGQNLRAIDANGKDLGFVTSWDGEDVSILADEAVWNWSVTTNVSRSILYHFFDSSCTTPFVLVDGWPTDVTPTLALSNRYVLAQSRSYRATVAYKPTGGSVRLNTLPAFYRWDNGAQTCQVAPWDGAIEDSVFAFSLETTTLLEYTAPLSIVAK